MAYLVFGNYDDTYVNNLQAGNVIRDYEKATGNHFLDYEIIDLTNLQAYPITDEEQAQIDEVGMSDTYYYSIEEDDFIKEI